MFLVWAGSPYRPTKDLDLLAVQTTTLERLAEIFRELCDIKVVADGLVFLPTTVKAEAIREHAAYQGVRVKLESRLGKIKIPLQVDIGFGDSITPKPEAAEFPALLDFPAPWLVMYAKETAIAEKFEAMVRLDEANSRMKDFYDIWALSRAFEFEAATLGAAIRATFDRRQTELASATPAGLTEKFAENPMKIRQWQAFVRRGWFRLEGPDWAVVISAVREFLMPVVTATLARRNITDHWPKGGPWQKG
jgi:hypothetical protein